MEALFQAMISDEEVSPQRSLCDVIVKNYVEVENFQKIKIILGILLEKCRIEHIV